ncbi:MAG: hypothetical protein HQL65_08995 [Magnetococcales bacterium]|nr:hypothetical protein [Magnetococcales bacterium]
MFKSILLPLLLCMALLAASTVEAGRKKSKGDDDIIDLNAVTCGEFVEELQQKDNVENVTFMIMWIYGYLGGLSEATRIDMNEFGKLTEKLGEYCAKNPKTNLLKAAKKSSPY